MRGLARFVPILVGFVVTSLPALAADTPLSAIPDDASIIVRLKAPKQTLDKVTAFVNNVQPGMGVFVQNQANAIGMLVDNPQMAGVDQEKDWWVVAFANADKDPEVVFATPTNDAAALKEAVGTNHQFVDYENWVLYSRDADKVESIKKRVAGTGKSIDSVFAGKSRTVFDGGDISVFVNVEGLTKTYRQQLDMAKLQLEGLLQSLPTMVPEVEGVNLEAMLGIYGQLFKGLFQAMEDMQTYVAAGSISADGIVIDELCSLEPGSATQNAVQTHATSKLDLVSKLPEKQLAYFAFHGDMKAIQQWGMGLILKMFEADEDLKTKFQKLLDDMGDLKYGDAAGSFSLGKLGEGLFKSIGVTEVTPIDKMRELSRTSAVEMNRMGFGGIKQDVSLVKDAEKYGEYSADILKIKQEFTGNPDMTEIQKRITDAMFGPGGMSQRFIYLKDEVIQASGAVSRPEIEAAIKALTASSANRTPNSIDAARKNLGEKSNILVLIDLPGILVSAVRAVAASGLVPLPIDTAALDNLQLKTSYIGFSMAAEPEGLRFKCNVPVDQVRGMFGLVAQFQGMMMRPPQF